MAKHKKQETPELGIQSVENALSKTERYIEENQKSLTIIVLAIIVVVGGYIGYKRLYLAPVEHEAQSQLFMAEKYFEKDSFNLALMGDGSNLGFLDIIDEYSITKSANLANYYAGISYLHMGDFENAIEYLKKFEANDKIVSSVAFGAIADAYVELGEYDEAITFFTKAANNSKNNFTAPIYLKKAGLVYEELDEYKKALDAYKKIQKDYPKSTEARDIEKYIEAVELKL
ncbi:MAG: tetratricopeptide repeat protein [Bacteroidales bacterium]|nr:tetratricopeptide repeat protein [Bacteroidales bacterium]